MKKYLLILTTLFVFTETTIASDFSADLKIIRKADSEISQKWYQKASSLSKERKSILDNRANEIAPILEIAIEKSIIQAATNGLNSIDFDKVLTQKEIKRLGLALQASQNDLHEEDVPYLIAKMADPKRNDGLGMLLYLQQFYAKKVESAFKEVADDYRPLLKKLKTEQGKSAIESFLQIIEQQDNSAPLESPEASTEEGVGRIFDSSSESDHQENATCFYQDC